MSTSRTSRTDIHDRPLSKGKSEVHVSTFALLFSEIVQYCQNRVHTVADMQIKLANLGYEVGSRMVDILFLREKQGFKRDIRIINILSFIKINVWKNLFGKEADKLEKDNNNEKIYYILENEPLVNRFISAQKDKGTLNCAAFEGGIIEAILHGCKFPAKVQVHYHGAYTAFIITFEESVIQRDKLLDGR